MRINYLLPALVALATASSQAAVVYTSPGWSLLGSHAPYHYCSSCSGGYQVTDTFSLSAATTLTEVAFGISSFTGSNHNIHVSVWDSSFSNNLFSMNAASGTYGESYVGNDQILASISLPGWSLDPGNYRISWYDPVDMTIPIFPGTGGMEQYYLFGANRTLVNEGYEVGSAPFQLSGASVSAVPLPGAIWLFGSALLGMLGLKARKRSSDNLTPAAA